MRITRWGGVALAAAAALAALAGRSRAEIHNGGVDCTNWNGTYHMLGSYTKDPSLAPKDHDPIKIRQTASNLVPLATFGGSAGRHGGGEKIHDVVDARTVYAMSVPEEDAAPAGRVELRHRR